MPAFLLGGISGRLWYGGHIAKMRTWLAVVDRTAVLFLGVAAGVAIGLAFGGDRAPAPVVIPPPTIAVAPGVAPPPPATATSGPTPPETAAAAPPAAVEPPPPEVSAVQAGAMPAPDQLVSSLRTGGRVRIGVFGDSFGDGVWSGLNHLLTEKAGYDVVKFSRQATGFTRYKSLNLEAHAREQLGDQPIDIAVVSFGANDTQGVIDRDGHYAALMSPGWQKEIGARVDAFVAVLRQHGAMVYWVGLPRMRKASFDADIMNMDAFYAAKMHALGVPFIDTRPSASDASGNYAAYLPDPKDGHQVLMRADDGIHMSMNGYVWITRGLAGRIRAYVDAARAQAGIAPPAEVALAAPSPAPKPPRAAAGEPAADRPRPAPEKRRGAPEDARPAPEKRAAATDEPRVAAEKTRAAPDRPATDRPATPEKPKAAKRSGERLTPDKPRPEDQPRPADRPKPADKLKPADKPRAAADRPRPAEKAKPAWLRTEDDPPVRPTGDNP